MKIIYTTLDNQDEARRISKKLLENNLANCTNWYEINCMYNFEGKIEEEPEVVLIIKTLEGKFTKIEKVIKSEIEYTNFIGELNINKINSEFENWINTIVK